LFGREFQFVIQRDYFAHGILLHGVANRENRSKNISLGEKGVNRRQSGRQGNRSNFLHAACCLCCQITSLGTAPLAIIISNIELYRDEFFPMQ
jgi:hypothetical protein